MSGDILTPILMGVMLGGLYALTALGLSMVFGVMRLINLAHGDLVVLGAYGSYAVLTMLGIDPILGLVITVPLMFCIGILIQKYLMSKAVTIGAEAPLIIAFGLSLIIQNANQIMFSPQSRGINTAYSQASFHIFGRQLPMIYLLDFIVGVVVMLVMQEFLKRTYMGRAISAAAQDTRASKLMGINTKRIYYYAFGIAMVSAAIAGTFLGMTFPFTPTSGTTFLTIAFGAVIIGGLGSMMGTFLGGIILGVVQTLSAHFLGANAQMLVLYVIILILLAFRPQGLFGR
ncbi:branched-chain amino acid ABC transporter permease [Holophaga foetida]|uniref:branched-chain amino acid ABC transporter permease n=1 Tax=Holophaga foetida TaxID=35839 RepID=UPI000247180B|nr:branched-chain amino acid ABC transporter permease [Holophaga foetida]